MLQVYQVLCRLCPGEQGATKLYMLGLQTPESESRKPLSWMAGAGGHIILRPPNPIFCFHVNPLPPVCHTLNSQGTDPESPAPPPPSNGSAPHRGCWRWGVGTAQLCLSPPQPTWTVFLARSQVNTEGSAHSEQRQINRYFLNTDCLLTLTETFTYMIFIWFP